MTMIPSILALIAAVFAIYELLEARGRSLLAWSVVLLAIAILWARIA